MDGCSEYLSAAAAQNAMQKNVRDRVKKETADRKRAILYLISGYLKEQNLSASSECLEAEAQLSNDFEVCDNIDLDTILQEYQSYYYAKFNKHAKILRKSNTQTRVVHIAKETKKKTGSVSGKVTREVAEPAFEFEIKKLLGRGDEVSAAYSTSVDTTKFDGYSSEWRDVAEIILKEVVPDTMGVTWKDCVGLRVCVDLLKEAVVYPLLRPELFTGLVTAWKGVLLYGPPGTGGAVAFALDHFIDEIDALANCSSDIQHDASRRFKAELLIQLDGILRDDDKIFVLATTNRPWDLDAALLRRFEKRILVDLPNEESRSEILRHYFSGSGYKFNDVEFDEMAKNCVDFSGSDIKNLCREACMAKLRQGIRKVENKLVRIEDLHLNPPCLEDVLVAVKKIRPVTNLRIQEKYLKWRDEFGCC
ncbi:hypothetical protein FQR65_LT07915 [Abscondita terminalis]|nr:hypothetical protein FQR65_LT07915 [Abscondita terminalis]